jgi:K+-transporting ATPase ATPase B chain
MSVTTDNAPAPAASSRAPEGTQRRIGGGLLDPKMLWKSLPDAFKKLDPRVQIKNPVMFVVEVGAVLCIYTAVKNSSIFNWTIVVWPRPSPKDAARRRPTRCAGPRRRRWRGG